MPCCSTDKNQRVNYSKEPIQYLLHIRDEIRYILSEPIFDIKKHS